METEKPSNLSLQTNSSIVEDKKLFYFENSRQVTFSLTLYCEPMIFEKEILPSNWIIQCPIESKETIKDRLPYFWLNLPRKLNLKKETKVFQLTSALNLKDKVEGILFVYDEITPKNPSIGIRINTFGSYSYVCHGPNTNGNIISADLRNSAYK